MSRLIVIGSINLDLVLETNTLPSPGETVLGGTFSRVNGGKGANQAVASARGRSLDSPDVVFLAAVGDDEFGRSVVQDFQNEPCLDASLIVEKKGFSTGVAAILVDRQAENMICVAPGANAALSVNDVEGLADEHFENVAVLLASMEVPLDTINAAVKRSKAGGATIILNPAPVVSGLAEHGVMHHVDILTPNEHEASQLSGIEIQDVASAVEAARVIIRKFGIATVVVTRGAEGVVVIDGQGQFFEVAAPHAEAVDTTAAGDCFNGVLAVQLASGMVFSEAVSLAVQAASLSVTRRGAQTSLPTIAEFAENSSS